MTPSEALTTARAMLDNKHCIFSPREYREVIRALLKPPALVTTDTKWNTTVVHWWGVDLADESRN